MCNLSGSNTTGFWFTQRITVIYFLHCTLIGCNVILNPHIAVWPLFRDTLQNWCSVMVNTVGRLLSPIHPHWKSFLRQSRMHPSQTRGLHANVFFSSAHTIVLPSAGGDHSVHRFKTKETHGVSNNLYYCLMPVLHLMTFQAILLLWKISDIKLKSWVLAKVEACSWLYIIRCFGSQNGFFKVSSFL